MAQQTGNLRFHAEQGMLQPLHSMSLPVGMCVIRTALSVVLTCCPPAPLALWHHTADVNCTPGVFRAMLC